MYDPHHNFLHIFFYLLVPALTLLAFSVFFPPLPLCCPGRRQNKIRLEEMSNEHGPVLRTCLKVPDSYPFLCKILGCLKNKLSILHLYYNIWKWWTSGVILFFYYYYCSTTNKTNSLLCGLFCTLSLIMHKAGLCKVECLPKRAVYSYAPCRFSCLWHTCGFPRIWTGGKLEMPIALERCV